MTNDPTDDDADTPPFRATARSVDPVPPGRALLLLCLAAVFAYANSFQGALQFDDASYINEPQLKDLLGSEMMKARPVVAVSLSVNYWLDGTRLRGFHLMNLAIHVAAAFTAYQLVRRTLLLPRFGGKYDRRAGAFAFAVAVLWLVHPLQTQCVTYLIQRCESLMGLFFLLALAGAQRAMTAGWWGERLGWGILAAVAAGLSGLCKEVMIALPPVAFLYDVTFVADGRAGSHRTGPDPLSRAWWRATFPEGLAVALFPAAMAGVLAVEVWFRWHRDQKVAVAEVGGLSVLALLVWWAPRPTLRRWPLYSVFTLLAGGVVWVIAKRGFLDPNQVGVMGFGVSYYNPYTYALTETQVILHYLRLCVMPDQQALDYLGWLVVNSPAESPWSVVPVSLAVLAGVVGTLFRTWWGFLLAAFFLILAPTSSVIPIQDAAFEHRMYLPLLCVAVFAVAAADRLVQAWKRQAPRWGKAIDVAAAAALTVAAVALSLVALHRNEEWASIDRLIGDNFAKRPNNYRVCQIWSCDLLNRGESAKAAEVSQDGVKRNPWYALVYVTAGMGLTDSGHADQAADVLNTCYGFAPDTADLRPNLGWALLLAGRANEALPHLKATYDWAVGAGTDNSLPHLRYILCLYEAGQTNTADFEAGIWAARDSRRPGVYAAHARGLAHDRVTNPTYVKTAVMEANAVCRADRFNTPEYLDTLAIVRATAARDEAGFKEAADTAAEAALLADGQKKPALAAAIRAREALFRANLRDLPENHDLVK